MELLGPALAARGAYASPGPDGTYSVSGVTQEEVGDVARDVGARVHELMTRRATLEEAFLDVTGMSEEFVGSSQQRPALSPSAGQGQSPAGPAESARR
jgi:ABC-2 type transport system ATP-binding protein